MDEEILDYNEQKEGWSVRWWIGRKNIFLTAR